MRRVGGVYGLIHEALQWEVAGSARDMFCGPARNSQGAKGEFFVIFCVRN